MFAVILMSAPVMPVWAKFVLYALAFGCVGMVGHPRRCRRRRSACSSGRSWRSSSAARR